MQHPTAHAPQHATRAVIITGAGRAFSAGGDLDFLQSRTETPADDNADIMMKFYRGFMQIRTLPVPTIAAINGPAIGAGACFAAAADIRMTHAAASIGFTFVKLGLHPGMAATFRLPQLIGPQAAARLLYTGEIVTGAAAEKLGFVSQALATPEELHGAARDLAGSIAKASPVAVGTLVRTLREGGDNGLDRAIRHEADAQAHCYAAPDMQEGLAALREKRAPQF